MDYEIGVYGDSIAFGYGCSGVSWFDMLSSGKTAVKSACNGEKISDVLRKIQGDGNCYQTLIIAVGINDLLQPSQKSQDLRLERLITDYERILKTVKAKAGKVIIQSVLPVRETEFPNQDWLDCKMWVFNENVLKFNNALLNMVEKHKFFYLDAYQKFETLSLPEFYIDAVHLNQQGQQKLFKVYNEML